MRGNECVEILGRNREIAPACSTFRWSRRLARTTGQNAVFRANSPRSAVAPVTGASVNHTATKSFTFRANDREKNS